MIKNISRDQAFRYFLFVTMQISPWEKKVTMIKTRVTMARQSRLPPSLQPRRKTSNAKTPQVHFVLNVERDVMFDNHACRLHTDKPPVSKAPPGEPSTQFKFTLQSALISSHLSIFYF